MRSWLSWRPSGRFVLRAILGVVGLFVAIQLVPYGRDHSNPPITGEPDWATPRTRELMVNACFDCHSNEVNWPWYSNVAPMSWVVTNHVEEGRDEVNYSEFGRGGEDGDDTIETILEGDMPPGYYTLFGLHPKANLSDAEIDELVAGLRATPGLSEDEDEDDDHDDEED
ncbi:MAG: heme-binding domain-containing protein, partial [Actinomycetia bacterium]|nr:heme-binding domain-containing protein [Actinomycetes bacterium]